MASPLLDAAAIVEILDNAGPVFLSKIQIEPFLMAYLVQAGVLNSNESRTIQATEQSQRCNALFLHLYSVSPKQFVDFCLVLCDKQQKEEVVTEDFRLNVEDLRAQQKLETDASATDENTAPPSNEALEELAKMYTALNIEDIRGYIEDGETDLASRNERKRKNKEEVLDKWIIAKYGLQSNNLRKEINLVLLGNTGAGKSATGNMILGKSCFRESDSFESCTSYIEKGECHFEGVKVNVIDTPGFQDTKLTPEDILTEISKVLDEFSDGIDGMLFVFNMGNPKFTPDQKKAFAQLEKGLFGEGAIVNCFVILTHVDTRPTIKSLSSYLKQESENPFGHLLVNMLHMRVIGVNNGDTTIYGREIQRQNIIRQILAETENRFCSDQFRKYQENQAKQALQLPDNVRHLAPVFQQETAAALRPMSHQAIKELSYDGSRRRAVLVNTVGQKVMEHGNVKEEMKRDVQKGATIALVKVSTRYTGKEFLEDLGWAVGIFVVAGGVATMLFGMITLPVVVAATAASGVAASYRWFMRK